MSSEYFDKEAKYSLKIMMNSNGMDVTRLSHRWMSNSMHFFPFPSIETDELLADMASGYVRSNPVFSSLRDNPGRTLSEAEKTMCSVGINEYLDRFMMYKGLFE